MKKLTIHRYTNNTLLILNNEDHESENESDTDQERKISHAAGKNSVEIALQYVEQHPTSQHLSLIHI